MRGSTGNLTTPSKMAIKGKKYYMWVGVSLESNITLMTVGDINVSRNAKGCSKVSQGRLRRKKVKVSHSKTLE